MRQGLTEEVLKKAFEGGIGSREGSDGRRPLRLPLLRLHTKLTRSLDGAFDSCPAGTKLRVALQTDCRRPLVFASCLSPKPEFREKFEGIHQKPTKALRFLASFLLFIARHPQSSLSKTEQHPQVLDLSGRG